MRKSSCVAAAAFLIAAIPGSSWADSVTLVGSTRAISVSAVGGATSTGTTSMFNQDVLSNSVGAIDPLTGAHGTASAFLSSFLSSSSFGGHGAVSTSQQSTTVGAGGHAQANYFVTIDLDAARRFDFGASFTGSGGDQTNRASWEAYLFYYPNGPDPLTAFRFGGTGSDVVSESSLLGPGRYGFTVNAVSDSFGIANGSAGLDYTFSLKFSDAQAPAPVPEPTSLLLLVTGLGGMAIRRRVGKR